MPFEFNPVSAQLDLVNPKRVVIPVVDADPATPKLGEAWTLRTLENPAGTLQAFVGGIPHVTAVDDFRYELSINTGDGPKRTLLS